MGVPIESTEVYRRSNELSDRTWGLVSDWTTLAQDTLGKQLFRSMDSVAANLVEGDARGSDRDTARFFVIARSSGREARHWLFTARRRQLVREDHATEMIGELTEIVKMINGLVRHRRSRQIAESMTPYDDEGLSPFLTPNP